MNPDKIQALIDHYTGQIAKGVAHYGPQAWSVMLQVKQTECVANLLIGAVQLILGAVVALILARVVAWAIKKADADDCYDSSGWVSVMVCSGALCVGCIVIAINGVTYLADPWAWIGALHPQISVAHDIIQKALGS